VKRRRCRGLVIAIAALLGLMLQGRVALADVPRVSYAFADAGLTLEFLDDDLLHAEFAPAGQGATAGTALPTTPMVLKVDFSGPSQFNDNSQGRCETTALSVEVDRQSPCFAVVDRSRSPALRLSQFCFQAGEWAQCADHQP
jgi:hypothetical protein